MRRGREPRSRVPRLLAVTLCLASAAEAQAPDVVVERLGPPQITADPGAQLILSFRVTNRGRAYRLVQTDLALPPDWRLIIPDSSVGLVAGASALRLLVTSVPTDARAGTYLLRYAATPVGELPHSDSVWVNIAERQVLTVSLQSAPRFVAAGAAYTAVFNVRNAGNAPATVRLELAGSRGLDARLDSTIVYLQPGEERDARAVVRSDARVTSKVIQRVRLVATPAGDTAAQASTQTAVEVIPIRDRNASSYHTVPMRLAFRQATDDDRVTPELRGSGYLTSARATRIDFVFRPSSPRSGYLGQQDEYRLNLTRPGRFQLQLGDQWYSGSRLTQPRRPGVGAAGELRLGPLLFSGQSQRDRRTFAFTRELQHVGNVDLILFSDRARIGGGFLSRSGLDSAEIRMARVAVTPFRGTTLRSEFGRGTSWRGNGDAYEVALDGTLRRITYAFRTQAADTGFPGLGAGFSHSHGYLRVRAFRRLGLIGSAGETKREPRGFPASPGIGLQRALEGGFDYAGLIGATYRQTRDTGFIAGPSARTGESVRGFLVVRLWRLSLRGTAERGFSIRDDAPEERIPFQRTGGFLRFSAGGQSFSGSVERRKGRSLSAFAAQDVTSSRFNASLRITRATRVNLGVSTNQYHGPGARTYTALNIGVGQQLPFGHSIGWRSQSLGYSGQATHRQTVQYGEYVIPLSFPLARLEESGVIGVRLLEGSTRRPMSGVPVRVGGDARVTDGNGRARFSGLAAGTHYVDVDRTHLAPGQIVAPATPLETTVGRGESRTVELYVERAARVSGAVHRLEFWQDRPLNAPDTLVDAGGLANVRLLLANNGDTLRTVSNGGGRFVFGDVHPGRWVLSVMRNGLPATHRFEEERIEIDVRGGEGHDVSLRALPIPRAVRIVEEVEIPVTPFAGPPGVLPPAPTTTAPPAAAVERGPTGARPPIRHSYTVTRWDISLMQIARFMYDDESLWPKIWVANRRELPNPDVIRAGQRLVVPAKAPLTVEELAALRQYQAQRRR